MGIWDHSYTQIVANAIGSASKADIDSAFSAVGLSERQLNCLATSGIQSGFEVLYFTPGASWNSLMNILTQAKLNGQFVNRLYAGFQRKINGSSGRKKTSLAHPTPVQSRIRVNASCHDSSHLAHVKNCAKTRSPTAPVGKAADITVGLQLL